MQLRETDVDQPKKGDHWVKQLFAAQKGKIQTNK